MKYPSELINYIENELVHNHAYRNYAETVDLYYGKLTVHVWSIGFIYTDDPKAYVIKEIYRENDTHKRISTDFYFTQLGGWQTLWTAKKYSYYGMIYPKNEMTDWNGKKPNLTCVKHLWSYQDIRKLDNSLKYFYLDEKDCEVDLLEFIKTWKKYPVLETLSKAGLHYFYTDKRVLNLKGEKKASFVQWVKNNREYVLKYKPPYNEICKCARTHMNHEQYLNDYGLDTLIKYLKPYKYTKAECKDIHKYLRESGYGKDLFKDYIELCLQENMNVHDRGVMFPRNLHDAHNELLNLKEARENKEHDKNLNKISKLLEPIIQVKNGFSIVIPNSQKQIIGVGEKLHNCVGRCGYGREMANGKIIIAVVCKDNEYLECCELKKEQKSLSIVQLRGDHNQDSKYHKEAKSTIRAFIERYNANNMSRVLAR